jgi:hypothetical protein
MYILNVYTDKLLQTETQMKDPTSHQRQEGHFQTEIMSGHKA